MSGTPIRLIVRMQVKPGRVEDFKKYVEGYSLKVEESEPATLAYECFVHEAGAEAYQNELYADSPSFLTHHAAFEAQLDSALEVCSIEDIRVLGDPDQQVTEKLSALGATIYSRHTGFAR
jgi:quinol monooxygenase YgiN